MSTTPVLGSLPGSVAIADSIVRKKLVERCKAEGFNFFPITDPSHISHDNVQVGEGSIFCAFTMVTGDATIGKHFQRNIYSYLPTIVRFVTS
jgi:acetyltransferase-like isoleucine patch superfamily enzyme